MATICLNMIVKNEAHVICRGLDTVKRFIDYWVIVDTGSTDGTQDVIREHMKDVPGELHERPWKDFGRNRSEAIELARDKADYLLFLDADEELITPPGWEMPELVDDAYRIVVHHPPALRYDRVSLVATALPWRFEGVLHEHVCWDGMLAPVNIPGIYVKENPEGARSKDAEKYMKDVEVLKQGLRDEPYNPRYVFYLAQSYTGMGDWQNAVEQYERRIAMGGWDQEIWYSHLQVARGHEILGKGDGAVTLLFLRAFNNRPIRAEPLYHLAVFCRTRKPALWPLGYMFAKEAAGIPYPSVDERLFVQDDVYRWRALDEWAVAAYETKRYTECKLLCERLLSNPQVPDEDKERIRGNLDLSIKKLGLHLLKRA